MENEARAKQRLFEEPELKHAVLNLDDVQGARLARMLAGRALNRAGYSCFAGVAARARLECYAEAPAVTSDNPRGEDPADISAEITAAIPVAHEAVEDRRTAIARAIASASADDVVLIAGKGHESYQEIAGRRLPFSDALEAEEVLARWGR